MTYSDITIHGCEICGNQAYSDFERCYQCRTIEYRRCHHELEFDELVEVTNHDGGRVWREDNPVYRCKKCGKRYVIREIDW